MDYLRALNLAQEGSKPEALRVLAGSLRRQPEGNPAASLAFMLLTELRANSRLVLRGHTDGLNFAAYSPDGSRIVTASEDKTARIWDARTGRQTGPPLPHEDEVRMAEFSPDGARVVTASGDGTARVWDAATGQPIGEPMRADHGMLFARFSPDGERVATGAEEGFGALHDARTGEPLALPYRYHGSVFSVNFSPDGKRVVTATADGKAEVFSAELQATAVTKRPAADRSVPLGTLRHQNNVFTAEFSPDGARILTASADGTARVWDAQTFQPLGPALAHGYWVWEAKFDAEARRVATASWDHTARVWDAATGQPLTAPLQHAAAVLGVAFSPDGARVATASRDGTARLWDAATGDPLTLGLRPGQEVSRAVFSPDGRSLLVVSKDRTAQLWDLPPGGTPPPWLADLADFASTQINYDTARVAQTDAIKALRERMLASSAENPWEKFGRWYFLESDARPVSPWSTLSLKEYVDGLIAEGDKESLDYAISLSQNVPAWMVRLVPLRAKFDAAPSATPPKDDD